MLKSYKTKGPCTKETMTVQVKKILKNKDESTQERNGPVINGTKALISSEFPMKPFKGTKTHLEGLEESETNLKRRKNKKADFNDEIHSKIEKKPKYDPSKVMHKLEQFSDVWNDCPDVENPKSGFEIVPNIKNEVGTFNKKNFENKTKNKKIINSSGKAQDFTYKGNREIDDHDQINSYKQKSRMDVTNSSVNRFKEQVSDVSSTVKYDSKIAEMKRKKAVEEQNQLHADQKTIIKKALSSTDTKLQTNKKIVFSDAEDNEEYQIENNLKSDQTKNQKLFEDDDVSSDADFELKVNSQFEGKKGQKLLELQSKFASDSRFTLDSRFQDSESENEKDVAPAENLDTKDEKRRQLEILESIVKQPIRPLSETKKSGNKYDGSLMVRFDPTREDHEKYLLKPQKQLKEELAEDKKKKKSNKEKKSLSNVEENKPKVSSEKIYAVKDDLKEVLRKENKTEFSLLNLFGSKGGDSNTQQEGSESIKKLKYATKNPFKYDSSESESEEEESKTENKEKEKATAKPSLPSWRTTFFFTDNDSRFKEAEEFLKGPEENEGNEQFAEKRKLLKDFIRHKLKNSNRKKDPFKKKLGGVKKKVFHKNKGK